jgi:hypothetical protein
VIIKHSEVRYHFSTCSGAQLERKPNFSGDIIPQIMPPGILNQWTATRPAYVFGMAAVMNS